MIDKPHSLTEKILTEATDFINDVNDDAKEVFYAGFEPFFNWLKKHKAIKAILILLLIGLIAYAIFSYCNTDKKVIVRVDNSFEVTETEYITKTLRVDEFLEENPQDYDPLKDTINCKIYTRVKDGLEINIVKSYDVYLIVDGITYEYNSLGVTTQELLDHFGINLGPYDTVDTDLNKKLTAGETVTTYRITIQKVVEQKTTSYATRYVKNTKMNIGDTKVTQEGKKGIYEKTYICVYENGNEISRSLIKEEEVQKAQTRIVEYGSMILTTVPQEVIDNALEVLDNVKAYSYHYSGTPYGVYGMYCTYHTVAVDRRVIPLGSKLFIEGYGYATANDVGGDIRGKTLDLYMEYRPQCSIWGARRVKVYILEYGDNTRYWERSKLNESYKMLK